MTRIEAIDLLDNLIGMVEDNHESDYDTALQMGIKALEYDDAKYHEEHGEVVVDKAVWEDAKKALEPCEDVISRQALLDDFGLSEKTRKWGGDHSGYDTMMLYEIQDMIESAPSVKQESNDFAKWVATEIFDEWEYNKDSFAEIACRKLEKLGIVRAKGDEWELSEQEPSGDEWEDGYKRAWAEAEVVFEKEPQTGHCKDCKHFRKLPYHADTLGKCIHHGGFCPKGDWYCADFEPQESEDKE